MVLTRRFKRILFFLAFQDLVTFSCLLLISVVSIYGQVSRNCARQSVKDKYTALFKIFPNRVQEEKGRFTDLLKPKKRRRFSRCGSKCKKPVVRKDEQDLVASLKTKILKPVTLNSQLDALTGIQLHINFIYNTQVKTIDEIFNPYNRAPDL